jgi:hypothetical protein
VCFTAISLYSILMLRQVSACLSQILPSCPEFLVFIRLIGILGTLSAEQAMGARALRALNLQSGSSTGNWGRRREGGDELRDILHLIDEFESGASRICKMSLSRIFLKVLTESKKECYEF